MEMDGNKNEYVIILVEIIRTELLIYCYKKSLCSPEKITSVFG